MSNLRHFVKKSPPQVDAFVVIWDIEASHLDAHFGFMLTAGWKAWHGGKPCPCHKDYRVHMPSIRDSWQYHDHEGCKHRIGKTTDDRGVLDQITWILMQADAHITYNGKMYDWRFLQTRRWIHGWDLLPRVTHIDLLDTAKSQFVGSKSLKNISESDGTLVKRGKHVLAKTPVSGPQWVDAIAGDEDALKYVETHCRLDVLVLEHEYDRLQQQVWTHPNWAGTELLKCKFCQVGRLVGRGYSTNANKKKAHRFQCRNCGRYQQKSLTKKEAELLG